MKTINDDGNNIDASLLRLVKLWISLRRILRKSALATPKHAQKKLEAQKTLTIDATKSIASLLLVAFLILPIQTSAEQKKAANGLAVKTVTVVKQSTYREKRVFIGRIEASRTADTGFEIGGKLASIQVDEGDVVKKGDTLAVLDTQRLEAARKEAAAALEESRAVLALSQSTLKRIRAAVAIKAVSIQELDEAQEARNTAAASVNRHKAALERIDVDIEKSTLQAPFDSTVIDRIADEGRVIAAGAPVLRLQETKTPEARIALANGMADKFKVGDAVTLKKNRHDLPATVKAVLPVRDARARTVDVIFTLAETATVRPGDLVEITIEQASQKRGFWIPLSSLTETVRGLWGVYVIDENSTAQRKVVDLIYQNEAQAFVRGNLTDGEVIISDGIHRIVPGQAVKPYQGIETAGGE